MHKLICKSSSHIGSPNIFILTYTQDSFKLWGSHSQFFSYFPLFEGFMEKLIQTGHNTVHCPYIKLCTLHMMLNF